MFLELLAIILEPVSETYEKREIKGG